MNVGGRSERGVIADGGSSVVGNKGIAQRWACGRSCGDRASWNVVHYWPVGGGNNPMGLLC